MADDSTKSNYNDFLCPRRLLRFLLSGVLLKARKWSDPKVDTSYLFLFLR